MSDFIKREDALHYIGAEIVGVTQEGRELLNSCQFAIKQVPSADVVERSEVEILEAEAYAKGIDSERKRLLKTWGRTEDRGNG